MKRLLDLNVLRGAAEGMSDQFLVEAVLTVREQARLPVENVIIASELQKRGVTVALRTLAALPSGTAPSIVDCPGQEQHQQF